MKTISAGEFKSKCLKIMDEVNQTGQAVIITKRSKPVAKLVPVKKTDLSLLGVMSGTASITGDLFSTNEIWEVDDDPA
jgi:prevent-host-death family protein